jgi:hypothetical protein
MICGGRPAAGITVGAEINFAMVENYSQNPRRAIDLFSMRRLVSLDKVGLACMCDKLFAASTRGF